MIKEISPIEFSKLNDTDFKLIDVRTSEEYDIVNIGGTLIPLDEISSRHNEINTDKKIILLCHHGRRSMIACQILENLNYNNLYNLTGGIDKMAAVVNNELVRY
ncbi:MAG: rhodanese-like domain-containing protein [Rickettsiales bacterium]|jgi:rhodanese-related sulfurtransferase|nr:rhodanese-like domain-containing protein [Rickettsiales bacterium]